MNRRSGRGIGVSTGDGASWFVVWALVSVFLPLPLLLIVFVLAVTLVALPGAAPRFAPFRLVRFPAPPSLRGPPF